MVPSAIALLLLALAAVGLSRLTEQRPEESLPVCFCGVIGILYGFYCMDAFRLGLWAVCMGIVVVFWLGLQKQGFAFPLRMVTPGVMVYLGECVLFLLFFSGNFVTRHDELRLWAAVPKAIHATGKLQLGREVPIFSTMQSYFPGLAMLGAFFTAFCPRFSEGALFVGYACFALVFLLPALSGWDWRFWPLMGPAGLLLLWIPCFFTSHYGDGGLFGLTLFVDPLLGLAAAYAFYLAGHKPFRDGFHRVQFSLALMTLCLLKNTGLLFAAVALMCAAILDNRRKGLLLPLGMVFLSVAVWENLLARNDVQVLVPLQLHRLEKQAVYNLLRALISVNVVAYKVPLGIFLSFSFVYGVLMALYVLIIRLQGERGIIALGILLSTAAFLYGYALIYGNTLESLPRYLSTPLLCLAACAVLTGFPALTGDAVLQRIREWGKIQKKAVCWGSVFLGFAFLTLWCRIFSTFHLREAADLDAEKIHSAILQDDMFDGSGRVYLVMAGDGWENSHYHHRIFFDLISENINICNGLAQTQVVVPGCADPVGQWAQELRKDYDYVYLLTLEDALIPVFAELSKDIPEENSLYRVCHADTVYGIQLERIP